MHTTPFTRRNAILMSRTAPALACVLFACMALSACGGGGSQKPSTKSATATSTAPSAPVNASNSAGQSTPSEATVVAVAGTAPSSTPGPSSAKVVASVEGQNITLGQLRHRMGTMTVKKQEVPEPPDFAACVIHKAASTTGKGLARLRGACKTRYETLKREALNSLIHARWLELEAREHGLRLDEATLDKEVAKGLKAAAKFGQTLALTGQTVADVKYWQRVSHYGFLISDHINRQTPKATPQRIARYYSRHKQSFETPETRDLHLIRTDSLASARQALHEIRSGRSFQSVVKEVSTHQPIHSKEGSIPALTYNDYSEPHLSNAIFRAHPHALEGPVKLDASNSPKIAFGYYVFEVLRIHPPRQQSFAQVRAGIAARLPEELHALTLKAAVAAFRRKWRARSDCRAGYVVEDCRQYSGKLPFEDLFTL